MSEQAKHETSQASQAASKALGPIHEEVLLKLLECDLSVADEPEPLHATQWDLAEWQVTKDHGARWSTANFGADMPAKFKSRYRSAFRSLIDQGLVEPHRQFGGNITHAKLTESGTKLATQISESSK